NGESSGLNVEWPASSPNVTACGGSIAIISGSTISSARLASEVVWNEDPTQRATGGGISVTFPRPNFQANAQVPVALNGFPGRGIPDVTGHASEIFVRFRGAPDVFAVTSAVAPLWAGLVARINQIKGQR